MFEQFMAEAVLAARYVAGAKGLEAKGMGAGVS